MQCMLLDGLHRGQAEQPQRAVNVKCSNLKLVPCVFNQTQLHELLNVRAAGAKRAKRA